METHGIIESFNDFDEACHFLDHNVLQYVSQGWTIRDGSGIERIGVKWRVGLLMARGKEDKVD